MTKGRYLKRTVVCNLSQAKGQAGHAGQQGDGSERGGRRFPPVSSDSLRAPSAASCTWRWDRRSYSAQRSAWRRTSLRGPSGTALTKVPVKLTGQFLLQYPSVEWRFPAQYDDDDGRLAGYSDSHWAAVAQTR